MQTVGGKAAVVAKLDGLSAICHRDQFDWHGRHCANARQAFLNIASNANLYLACRGLQEIDLLGRAASRRRDACRMLASNSL
jgi:hypothetical protein